jgi:hypothetical protein
MNEDLLLPLYDQMLDETNEQIVIGNLLYSPSDVLKAVDPIAYEQGFLDYLDFLITEDERKYP